MTEYEEGQTGTDNATGQRVVYQGGQWVPIEQPAPGDPDVPVVGGPDTAAEPEGTTFAGLQFPGNSPLDMLGAFNPAFAGTTGIAAGLQGMTAAAGRSAPVAAMMTKAADAGSAVVDPIASALAKAGEAVSGVVEQVPVIGPSFARRGTRIKNEQLLKLATTPPPSVGAAAAPIRAHSTLYDPATLAQRLNISEEALTPAQRAKLSYTEGQADDVGREIRQALTEESQAVWKGTASPEQAKAWDEVDTAFTRKVIEDAGIPYGQMPDQTMISKTRMDVGQQIGQVLEANFPDDYVKILPENSLARVINANTDTEVAPALRVLKNYGAVKVSEDGAVDAAEISVENFGKMKSELTKLADSTTNPNVRMATDKILQKLDNNAVDGMDGEAQEAYSKLKYQYKLLSKLQEPGVVSRETGKINPASFDRQWRRGESKNMKHMNELSVLAETVQNITPKSNAGTTGGRSIADDVAPVAGAAVGRMLGL